MTARLEALAGLVDLRAIPFTEPGGRLLLRQTADGRALQVSRAVYERSADECGPVGALSFIDEQGEGTPIGATTWPHRVDLVVGDRPAAAAFVDPDLLMVRLPEGRSRLRLGFLLEADHTFGGVQVQDGRVGGTIEGAAGAPPIAWSVGGRYLAHETSGEGTSRPWLTLDVEAGPDDVLLIGIRAGAAAVAAPVATAPDPGDVLRAAEERWRRRLDAVPLIADAAPESALRAAWVLATNTLSLDLDAQAPPAVVPSKMGYVALWQWDAYFHAIGLRHLDVAAARDQLRLALRWQQPDGMLPDVVHDTGVVAASDEMDEADRQRSLLHIGRKVPEGEQEGFLSAPLTKPPLTAWAAWKVYRTDGDERFLGEVYPAIVRSHRWWFERSTPAGHDLPLYLHPYSSGIDDSPLWDHGMPVETPDLPAYLALQADHLALMAEALGDDDIAERWRAEAARLVEGLVSRHWHAAAGSFVSYHEGQPIESDTAIGLLPIITGRLPEAVAARLVETLQDPGRFWSPFPVPSVALGDPDFDPARMWRGPAWLFVDYLLIEGLRRSGFEGVANELRARVLRMVEQGTGTPEFYDPLRGTRPEMATATFSGTAALYLDLLLGWADRDQPVRGDRR